MLMRINIVLGKAEPQPKSSHLEGIPPLTPPDNQFQSSPHGQFSIMIYRVMYITFTPKQLMRSAPQAPVQHQTRASPTTLTTLPSPLPGLRNTRQTKKPARLSVKSTCLTFPVPA